MVIDTSALIAILQDEPNEHRSIGPLKRRRALPVVSFVEASMVIETGYGADGVRDLDLLIAKAGIELVSVDANQAYAARNAFRVYGKGRHRAGLNFGDCFPYALARTEGEPLLFKGMDFSMTDVAGRSRPPRERPRRAPT